MADQRIVLVWKPLNGQNGADGGTDRTAIEGGPGPERITLRNHVHQSGKARPR